MAEEEVFLSDGVCVIFKSLSEISSCYANILCFWTFLAMNYDHYVSRITVIVVWLNCLVINENLSSSINVFANFASMFATRFVALRFIIRNNIHD